MLELQGEIFSLEKRLNPQSLWLIAKNMLTWQVILVLCGLVVFSTGCALFSEKKPTDVYAINAPHTTASCAQHSLPHASKDAELAEEVLVIALHAPQGTLIVNDTIENLDMLMKAAHQRSVHIKIDSSLSHEYVTPVLNTLVEARSPKVTFEWVEETCSCSR